MDSYIKYSVLKVEEVNDEKDITIRTFTFEQELPFNVEFLYDFKGNGAYANTIDKYTLEVDIWTHYTKENVGKYKYLIIAHLVDSPASPEDYWKELGNLKKPTITQIKCYQYIINNLI